MTQFVASILGVAHLASQGFPFVQVASGPLESVRDQVYAAAWGDYDGDGRPDLYLSTLTGTDGVLLRNEASGLRRIVSGLPSVPDSSRAGAVWLDADNDGDLDLFVTTTSGEPDSFHLNLGNGTFTNIHAVSLMTGNGYGQAVTVSDFDGDGQADIFVANGGGHTAEPNLYLRGRNTGYFESMASNGLTAESLYSSGMAAADYDGDGFMDLFVSNIWGRNSLFRNSRNGGFERILHAAPASESDSTGAATAAWGDWDNDGDFDLVVVNGLPFDLYRNEGSGNFTSLARVPFGGNGSTCSGTVCADFNNDGFLDILVARREGAPLFYLGFGNGTFMPVINDPLVRHHSGANGIALADYDLDGDLDVLLTNWEGQTPPALFRNQSSDNAWLRVRLVGTSSQRNGIGARVRVETSVRGTQTRQVRQIGGYDSQGSQELIAHFGVGKVSLVDRVIVEWPSGINQIVTQVSTRQTITLSEPTAPLLSILPEGGTFTNQVVVTLRSRTPGAAIRYTTDSSEPTLSSFLYSQPFHLFRTTTVKARLFINGFPASDTVSAVFHADPGVAIFPRSGDFTNRVDVNLVTRLVGTTLRYTLDGTDPTSASTAYSTPIPVTESTTVRVVAFFNEFPVSEVVSATFRRVFVFGADGIPDPWRIQYFGSDFRYDPRAHQSADPDNDGSDNRQEFLAGSDPLDATSGFRVDIRALPELKFPSVPGVRYRILRRHSLSDPSPTVLQEITATGETIQFIDETAEATRNGSFYLVEPLR